MKFDGSQVCLANRDVHVMITDRSFQKLNPVGLLARAVSRQKSGCLQVSSQTTIWSIYLDKGKLVYASNSCDPIKRLESHLQLLGIDASKFEHVIRVARSLFEDAYTGEATAKSPSVQNLDYQVICWLVKHQCLTPAQATVLIKRLAKEVMGSFLAIREGNYKFIQDEQFDEFPKFCKLDVRSIVEYWRRQSRSPSEPEPAPPEPSEPSELPYSAKTESVPALESEAIAPPPIIESPDLQPLPSPEATDVPSVLTPGGTAQIRRQRNYTIACIDDSPAVLQKIKTFLTDQDISVLTIDNSVNALMQIVRNKPDLILLDVTMPNLDGYKLCSLLRKHPNFKNTPVIMVTGNTGLLDRAKAKLVGASGYLTKPFTQSDLIQTVFMHLS
ncbi:MAG TPA: response regulator [Crinalium sp.]